MKKPRYKLIAAMRSSEELQSILSEKMKSKLTYWEIKNHTVFTINEWGEIDGSIFRDGKIIARDRIWPPVDKLK